MTHIRRGTCKGGEEGAAFPPLVSPARAPVRRRAGRPAAMPAGVPWPTYLKTLAASLLAMFAGAEVVHRYYRPDLVSA